MKRPILITLVLLLGLFIGTSSAVEFTLFGPSQYLRTTGKPDVYNDSFLGTPGEGKLTLTNGTADGKNRISSASIFVNGQQVLGPSDFNQQVYDLEVPINLINNNSISVQLESKPGSYITVKITQEVAADATAAEVIGPEGGNLTVQNHIGDTATLKIPPLALTDPTTVSITTLATPPPNPFATIIYPGVILEPSGLIFSTPIKIRVDFYDALPNPEMATLYWLKDSNLALPIPEQTATQNSIEAEIDHFSTIIGATPTAGEIKNLYDTMLESGSDIIDTSTAGILSNIEGVRSLLELARLAAILGNEETSERCWNAALELLSKLSIAVLSSPLPADPCELLYAKAIRQLANMVAVILLDEPTAELLLKRVCHLDISPMGLILDTGESGGLTARLLDPNGDERSCSTLGWGTSNPSVVEITSTADNTCSVIAGDAGDAEILANCDGHRSSTVVHVMPKLEVKASPEKPYVGQSIQFTVIARNSRDDQITIPGSTITWSPAAGSSLMPPFPQTGLSATFVSNRPGPATVTASYRNGLKTVSKTICVRDAIDTIEVSPPSKTLFVGNTVPLTATAKNASGSTDFGCDFSPDFKWYSSNLYVATVDDSGNVRAVSKGVANISAVYGSKLGYSQVTVFDMTGTWYHREYWQSSTCPENTYEIAICTVNQTGNFLSSTYNGVAYYTGYFTGPRFNWTLIAPYWLNPYAMVTSSTMTGTVSADGLHYLTSDSWTAVYLDENGVWQSCSGSSVASGDRL